MKLLWATETVPNHYQRPLDCYVLVVFYLLVPLSASETGAITFF